MSSVVGDACIALLSRSGSLENLQKSQVVLMKVNKHPIVNQGICLKNFTSKIISSYFVKKKGGMRGKAASTISTHQHKISLTVRYTIHFRYYFQDTIFKGLYKIKSSTLMSHKVVVKLGLIS